MAKTEKVLRVNIPFRVLPDTLLQLAALAELEKRESSNMFEKIVSDLFEAKGLVLPDLPANAAKAKAKAKGKGE